MVSDIQEQILAELYRIRVLSGGSTDNKPPSVDVDVDPEKERDDTDISEPKPSNTGNIWTTGEDRIALTDTDWTRLGFSMVVAAVNIRFYKDDIQVAFQRPHNSPTEIIDLEYSADSPFSIGGDHPLDTAFMWVRKDPDASSDPEIRVVAYD